MRAGILRAPLSGPAPPPAVSGPARVTTEDASHKGYLPVAEGRPVTVAAVCADIAEVPRPLVAIASGIGLIAAVLTLPIVLLARRPR